MYDTSRREFTGKERDSESGRVAQPSASTKHIGGAPSFAHFAKGGTEDRSHDKLHLSRRWCPKRYLPASFIHPHRPRFVENIGNDNYSSANPQAPPSGLASLDCCAYTVVSPLASFPSKR
jgi:hypothetical protein